jgi:excisionase family DNA binding protein
VLSFAGLFMDTEHSGSAMTLMKVGDVAKQLNCSASLVYEHIASGRLRSYRIGKGRGGLRVSEEQLAAFLKETEHAAPSPEEDDEEFRHCRPASP